MIVVKHEGCGELFLTDENTKLPEVCPKARECHRPCNSEFEVVGIYQNVAAALLARRNMIEGLNVRPRNV